MWSKILLLFLGPLAKYLTSFLLTGIKEAIARKDLDELRKEKNHLQALHKKLTERGGQIDKKTAHEIAHAIAGITHKL